MGDRARWSGGAAKKMAWSQFGDIWPERKFRWLGPVLPEIPDFPDLDLDLREQHEQARTRGGKLSRK
jgi:hypothetical protein